MEFIRIAWCWVVIGLPIVAVYSLIAWPSLRPMFCYSLHEAAYYIKTHEAKNYDFSWAINLLVAFFGASVAVAWHRLILRNEHVPQGPYLRFDRVVFSYFILGVVIFFIESLPQLAKIIVEGIIDPERGEHTILFVKSLMGLVITIITLPYAFRISLALPARALSVPEVTLKEANVRSRGNFWRLFWGYFFCSLPVLLLLFLPKLGCDDATTGALLYALDIFLGMVIAAPVLLSFLSLSYRHFFEGSRGNI